MCRRSPAWSSVLPCAGLSRAASIPWISLPSPFYYDITDPTGLTRLESHLDAVHRELELEPLAGPHQVNHHTVLIPHRVGTSPSGNRGSGCHTCIGAVEVFELVEVVYHPTRRGFRNADVNDREAVDTKGILLPLVGQDAIPPGDTDAYRHGPCRELDGGIGLFLLRQRQTYNYNQASNSNQADHSLIHTLSPLRASVDHQ